MQENISTDHNMYAFILWYSYGKTEEYNNQSQSCVKRATAKHASLSTARWKIKKMKKHKLCMTLSATHVTQKHAFYFWSKCGNPEDCKSYPCSFVILRRKTQYESFPCLTLLGMTI
jgi:hypothetical protein